MDKSEANKEGYTKCKGCLGRYKGNHKCDRLMWLLCQMASLNKKEIIFIDCTPDKKPIQ